MQQTLFGDEHGAVAIDVQRTALHDQRRGEDPRALAFEDPPADCVIFGASDLGTLAVQAFNKFASDEHTRDIPSILLVDQKQSHIIGEASRGPGRKLLPLPLKVRELRAALTQLLAGVARRPIGTY